MTGLEDVLPLSPLQQGLLVWASYGAADVYAVQRAFDIEGAVDADALRAAGETLLRRHPNLRAAFRFRRSGDPVALVPRTTELPWRFEDLTHLDAGARRAELDRIAAGERARPFDLGRPPLLRLALIRTDDTCYTVLLTFHHILLDGWSVPRLVTELFTLYGSRGDEAVLGAPVPYRRYLAWLSTQDAEASVAAWRRYLDGLDGPTLVASGADLHGRSTPAEITTFLTEGETEALRGLTRRHEVTANTVLQTAWALVLGELTGKSDVVFGLSGSGRSPELPRADEIIGLLINTIPARVTPRAGETIAELLTRVQAGQAGLLAHQHVRLAELSAGGGELFDTYAVFENYPLDRGVLDALGTRAGLRIHGIDSAEGSHYPLGVIATPGDRLRLDVRYRAEAIPRATAERATRRLTETLRRIINDPGLRYARLPLLSPDERADLLEVRNRTEPAPPDATFADLVAGHAPDEPAVVYRDTTLTYRDLHARADVVAGRLAARGIGPERSVVVALPRSADQIVAMLAVLKAGGVYVPVDTDYPAERVAYLLDDAAPALVITAPAHTGLLPPSAPVALLSQLEAEGPSREPDRARPDNAAYTIYTSGSTGRPKAVVVTHGGLPALVRTVADAFRPGPGDRVLQFASQSFDTSVWELCMALGTGAAVVVAPAERRLGPELARLLTEERITHLTLPPSALAELPTDAVAPGTVVIVAGEACPPELARRWIDAGHVFFNSYGPTETTVDATLWRAGEPSGTALPIGRPVAGTTVYVLDALLRPVPAGIPGELYVGGTGLARGYRGAPGLTATRFVANPFGEGRLYRTGDLVRWREDGELEFLGRADHQIKIRGFRVEPGEVEATLAAHPTVASALVLAVDDEVVGRRLIAYVTPSDVDGEPDQVTLRAYAGRILPEHMVPSAVVVLDAFPLTPNGKVDRAALPGAAPAVTAAAQPSGGARPREELMCGVFASVLGAPEVGPDDSFFDLGGHSLLFARLVARVEAVFGATLSMSDVFEAPTPRDLARLLDAGRRRLPLTARDRSGPQPLSFAQRRLWFLHRLDGPSATYNIPAVLRIRGALDVDALRAALSDVVGRHESLRTVFRDGDGEGLQEVLSEFALPFEASEATEESLDARLTDAAGHRFALDREIPVRAHLFALGAQDHVLLVLQHHIAGDEWSVGPLFADLRRAYEARRLGRAPAFAPLPVQYADFAGWQRDLLGAEDDPDSVAAAQVAFWREALDGAPEELALPFDRPRPAVAGYAGDYLMYEIPAVVHRGLLALARAHDVTPFMAVQAAVAALLTRLGAGEDLPLGSPIAGRTQQELEDLVGFFANTLVLRVDTSGDPSFADLLGRVRRTDLAAFDHADVPFERLVEVLHPARSLSRNPLFQVMVTHQHRLDMDLGVAGLQTTAIPFGLDTAKFDLTFSFFGDDADGPLGAGIEFATELFDRATIAGLADRLTRLLTAVVTAPDAPIGAADLLSPGERVALTAAPEFPVNVPLVPEMVAAAAARYPERIALSDGSVEVSYAELRRRVVELAGRLPAGPEDVVALACPPSIGLVVAQLAVLHAGAAYLPLDTGYPAGRIALMLDDAHPALLITTAETIENLAPVRDWRGPLLYADPESAVTTPVPPPGSPPAVVVPPGHLPAGAVETGRPAADAAPGEGPMPRPRPENPAYVIFTSGSTGRPKGVVGTHGGLAARLAWGQAALPLGPGDTVVAKSSPSFIDGTTELLGALIAGATVVIADADTRRDTHALAALIETAGATRMTMVPSQLRTLLSEAGPDRLASVTRWVTSGEALTPDLVAALPGITDLYGCSEASGDSLARPHPADATFTDVVTGTAAYVLDGRLRPVPPGATGELYLAGAGLARGYRDAPGLTATRFVASPFTPGERLYRTGDLARRTSGGGVALRGRADSQIKIRGVRVEPREVEAALAGLDGVAEAAVLARTSPAGETELRAYAVPAPGFDLSSVRAALRRTLPAQLVPATLIPVDRMPRLPGGKTDRRALARLDSPISAPDETAEAGERERLLAQIFADVLSLPSAGLDQDFFDLGGHSLAATRLVSRIRAVFGAEVPLRAVFEAPTVRELAGRLTDQTARPPITARARPDRIPLSFAQRRLWFLDRLEGPGTVYTIPLLSRLRGDLDVDALRAAVADVVARHEPLRTLLVEHDGEPWQHILAEVPDVFTVHGDDAELPARHRFALDAEPPIRVDLTRTGPREWLLLILLHHTAADALSTGPLVDDLETAYAARLAGSPPAWTPLAVQYADVTLWQREQPDYVGYWRDRLAGAPAELALPTDRPRPALPGYTGGTVSEARPDGLDALARTLGVTPFMLFQAAVAALLSRLGAGEDVPLGAPVGGRTDPALERLVGFLVDTVVLRTDVSGDPTLAELAARVRDADLADFAHQDMPFERLVEALKPERARARHPLFQVLVNQHRAGEPGVRLAGLASESVAQAPDTAKFDLSFLLEDDAVSLNYAADLFDHDSAETMLRRLTRLLRKARPDTRMSELDVLLPEERESLRARNATGHDVPGGTVVDRLIEAARTHPYAIALLPDGGAPVTYAELNRSAAALARTLRNRGVAPGDVVGVRIPRGPELVTALWGVLRAGAAYLPIDPDHPDERAELLRTDAGARLVLSADDVRAWSAGPAADLPPPAPDLPAYVIYTSGSTGRPKGVRVPHRALTNRLEWMQAEFRLGDADAVLQKTPATFDVSVWEFFWPALAAAPLVIAKPGGHRDPGYLAALIRRARVTVAHFVPSMLREFVATPATGSCASLRLLVTSGEALPADLAAATRRLLPHAALHNLYGPTEATVDVTAWHVTQDDVPIGRPIWNTRAHVLDRWLRPVPDGVPGELYLAGVQLADGYLGRAALTAERFVADPHDHGRRLYRTGDLARWRPDGALDFLGRTDHQVKVRGLRIEPGEVEAALTALPEVAAAVVVAHGDRLAGYVTPAPGHRPEPGALRAALAGTLPEYLIPSIFVVLAEFPLTTSGKVDRRALPDPAPAPAGAEAPRGLGEEVLSGVFADLLGLDRVGAEDDFFALGGHSLLAVRLVSRLRTVFGAQPALHDVFEAPTVRALAERLRRGGDRPPLRAGARPDPLPLSPAQQRLWFIDRMDGPSDTYNIPFTARFRGALDLAAFAAAASDVVARHEILRTVYPAPSGRAEQSVRPPRDVAVHTEGTLEEAIHRPFRLDEEIPIRFHALAAGPDEHVVAVVVHHIAADEWSARPLFTDLATAYAARVSGAAPRWDAPLPVQYADYALWQHELLGTGDDKTPLAAEQLAFWSAELAGLPEELALPVSRPRPPVATYRGELARRPLPADVASALRAVAAAHGVTAFMVLQAAVAVLLRKLGAGTDLPLGTPIAGRADAALDDLVGCFLNTLVLRTDVSGDPTFAALLDRVRRTDLAAFAHSDLPFERLVEHLAPARSLSRHPLFQVVTTHRYADQDGFGLAGLEVAPEPAEFTIAKFDLTFVIEEDATTGAVALELTCARDLFDDGSASRLLNRLDRVLRAVLSHPDQRISTVRVLDDRERDLVLHQWNETARDVPFTDLAGLFETQATARPDAVALVDGARELTYRQLDAAANRLAHVLLGRGAGPERIVAVALRRSAEAVAAILAVAKTGAAYLPIDPDHPASRVRHVLDDARPVLAVAARADDVPAEGLEVVDVAVAWGDGPAQRPDRAAPEPSRLAYVIYTSGSTGRPKGVAVPHAGLPDLVATMAGGSRGGTGARIGSFASFSFDVTVAELAISILSGGTIVLLPEHARAGAALARFATAQRLTHLVIPPSVLSSLPRPGTPEPSLGVDVTLLVGTEALRRDLIRDWAGGRRFLNCYGPTEATVNSTLWTAEPGWASSVLPIGRPDVNRRAYVLGPDLAPVPPGVTGELYLGGGGLARGYLGRAALTAERFVADPFGAPGDRLYRTGDLARWNAGGLLEYLGRADDQLKVRGLRIEPAEIEAALRDLPGVAAAAVAARPGADGRDRLVGYLVPAPGPQTAGSVSGPHALAAVPRAASGAATAAASAATAAASAVKAAAAHAGTGGDADRAGRATAFDVAGIARRAAELLPAGMVPSAWMVLDALPHTVAGKLDRDRLPTPQTAETERADATTDVEQTLVELFAELLGRDDLGATDGFFALGGDSILSIQLVARARDHGLLFAPRDVFENPTPRELAAVAAEAGIAAHDPGTGDVPLTPIMRRFVDADPAVEKFGQALRFSLPAGLTERTVRDGLRAILGHHDALRARLERDRLVVPADAPEPALTVVPGDSELPLEAARAGLDPWRGAMTHALWRDAGPNRRSELLLLIHHLVVDGVSWRILAADLEAACTALHLGRTPRLRPVATSLRTWAHALSEAALAREREARYWRDVLDAVTPAPAGILAASGDGPSAPGSTASEANGAAVAGASTADGVAVSGVSTADGVAVSGVSTADVVPGTLGTVAQLTRTLPAADTAPLLGEVPERLRATVNDVLLAALGLALREWTGGEAVIDLEGHGREQQIVPGADLTRTVGWFTTIYPVRLATGGAGLAAAETDPGRAAEAVKATAAALGTVPDHGIGYGLLRELARHPALTAAPRPWIAFNYLGRIGGAPDRGGDGWRIEGGLGGTVDGHRAADHTLSIDVTAVPGADGTELRAVFAYVSTAIEEDTVHRLATLWERALRAVAAAAVTTRLTPADVPLAGLDQGQLDRIAAKWATR
ncbi:amino acid adenylation domain-containing protein/non-ribosomal peptide synthase protein (TIGR01720 family) [Catenuloplanes nepalensis]|uniref:Amino acid adenylation domain-containing protein/non-ribosomal peptide synthase protein (TIGR01720 family) n=1 Tax=Catenuloplanes nepalensis TaxID=587533 RepID=A0ABT9MU93_9ACTN|nr:non-ribosomal peptide synthetase [Catenuloplanes nepalensis]MDP9795023.1 amino acid adenylation domain-containing protein/non-ribosomal peptide synthase protein (TIGR01720 family) [Catenuloplanes nepalensis]